MSMPALFKARLSSVRLSVNSSTSWLEISRRGGSLVPHFFSAEYGLDAE